MKLKENTTQRKLRGGYYTPQKLADYITKITLKDKKKILEPSCGDGSFLKSIKNILDNNDYNIEKIVMQEKPDIQGTGTVIRLAL